MAQFGKDFKWARAEGTIKSDTDQPMLSGMKPLGLWGAWLIQRQDGSKDNEVRNKYN